jgi:predicted Rdx family selenoprotein
VVLTFWIANLTQVVTLDDFTLWDRHSQGRFPDIKELKQLIRDGVAPDKDLGHTEENKTSDCMTDDEAAELRNFFGVR